MDTTVKALQTLYVALGGTLTDTHDGIADGVAVSDYVTVPDMINAIALQAATATAAELPAVTAAENGKVLKVADGKWAVGTDATA